MNNNLEKFSMNDDALEQVSGGDYGDYKTDRDPNAPRYQVGQRVKVYQSVFHFSTTVITIKDIRFTKGYWEYFAVGDGFNTWISADEMVTS
ncbi:MAG: hypothetical protein Q4B73_06570 [Lachnospiraceae bacterium]|nr:hypothetical protein [Lachnospiraceae bacterium]